MIKKVLSIALWAVIIGGVAWVVHWANQNFNAQKQQGVHVSTAGFSPQNLIHQRSIQEQLTSTSDSVYLSEQLSKLPIDSVEKMLSLDANLSEVASFIGLDGKVYVDTDTRQMCLRVFDQAGSNFYISQDAKVVNPSKGCSQRCLVANGKLPSISNADKLAILQAQKTLPHIYTQLLDLSLTIAKDEFLSALIAQIYVESDSNLILSAKTGVNSIIFGGFNHRDEKLKKIKDFYTNSAQKVDWQAYRAINVKYKNQVVCVKK